MENLGNKPLIVFISLLASLIGIYVFISGKANVREAIRGSDLYPPAAVDVSQPPVEEIPASPLTFTPCASYLACPEATSVFVAVGEPDPYDFNAEYTGDVSPETVIRFSTGWCTKEQQLLYDHLGHIQFVFAIDGISYLDNVDMQYETRPTDEDPPETEYCYMAGVGISNWQVGSTYRIILGLILDTDLYDGWSTVVKGDYLRTYVLTGQ